MAPLKLDINICSIELEWGGNILKYDTIARWGEYE